MAIAGNGCVKRDSRRESSNTLNTLPAGALSETLLSMNIVLFEPTEIGQPLPRSDARAQHILGVLRRALNEPFDVGVIDGPKGKGWIERMGETELQLGFRWGDEEPPLLPIDLIIGLSRPQTNRKILQEATTLGVRSMRFVTTDRGEPSYAQSKLWTSGEWRRHLIEGAAQAFATRLPQVAFGMSLKEAIADVSDSQRLALDNYEATAPLARAIEPGQETVLAIGSERGWTAKERVLLRERGFKLAHLGQRVLRTETATIVAVGLIANQ